jgi:hypothetical protein
MKRNRLALMCLLVGLMTMAGCEALDNFASKWTDNTAQTVQTVGDVAAPFTGGISSLVAGIIGAVVPTVFAVNRQLLKWKADKAAAASAEQTVQAQAATSNIVQAIDAAKTTSTKPGVVDFNDPATVKIINTLMSDAAKAAVDTAQGKAA